MNSKKRTQMIILSLLSVYLFWGGTFFGMKVAIETIPPFLMAGTRFAIAGIFLFFLAKGMGASKPTLLQWRETGIVGALLLLGGNGFVALAEQRVDSGIASLIVATIPLWVILFNWIGGQKRRPTRGVVFGIFLGFSGIAVLVLQPEKGSSSNGLDLIGMAILLFAAISWSFGSLYSVRAKFPESRLLTTAMQMLVGGALLLFLSFFLGDWKEFSLSDVNMRSSLAMGYLIVFGSIVSYNAYIWLLRNVDPSWVSTYAFINPVVAVFLGYMWGGERLSSQSIIGALIIITAVAIITLYRERNKEAKREEL